MTTDLDKRLKQAPPFRFVDTIIDETEKSLTASKSLTGKEDFYQGHFPDFPLTPGVLMCEGLLQSGAILLSNAMMKDNQIGVVTRMDKVKFKKQALPPVTLTYFVEIIEQMQNAYFFKGKVSQGDDTLLTMNFTVAATTRQ